MPLPFAPNKPPPDLWGESSLGRIVGQARVEHLGFPRTSKSTRAHPSSLRRRITSAERTDHLRWCQLGLPHWIKLICRPDVRRSVFFFVESFRTRVTFPSHG